MYCAQSSGVSVCMPSRQWVVTPWTSVGLCRLKLKAGHKLLQVAILANQPTANYTRQFAMKRAASAAILSHSPAAIHSLLTSDPLAPTPTHPAFR